MYAVIEIGTFEKESEKILSPAQRQQLERVKDRLAVHGWLGDALGPQQLREIRLQEKRIYFTVHEDIIFLVGVSSKKAQQEKIDQLRKRLSAYRALAQQLSGRV